MMHPFRGHGLIGVGAVALMCCLSLPAWAERTFENYQTAVLQFLDKPNARVEKYEVGVGKDYTFRGITVKVRSCRKTTPEDEPEAAAFLEINDDRAKDPTQASLYKGWMFASSPALSALEHPIYDVWVLDCKNPVTPPPAPEEPAAKSPAKDAGAPAKAKAKKP